jgi:hypothetical protein
MGIEVFSVHIGGMVLGLSLVDQIQPLVAQRAPAFFAPAGAKNDTQ